MGAVFDVEDLESFRGDAVDWLGDVAEARAFEVGVADVEGAEGEGGEGVEGLWGFY